MPATPIMATPAMQAAVMPTILPVFIPDALVVAAGTTEDVIVGVNVVSGTSRSVVGEVYTGVVELLVVVGTTYQVSITMNQLISAGSTHNRSGRHDTGGAS